MKLYILVLVFGLITLRGPVTEMAVHTHEFSPMDVDGREHAYVYPHECACGAVRMVERR